MAEEVMKFVSDVKKNFTGAKVLLFGSRAKGNARRGSDYDFIIISKKFKKIDFVDRAYEVWKKTNAIITAGLLCYSPDEIEKTAKKSLVLQDALKYAVSV